MTTFAPRLRNSRAAAAPIPELPPVMTMVFPFIAAPLRSIADCVECCAMKRAPLLFVGVCALLSCARQRETATAVAPVRPSILFVTLDTTRADAIGPDQSNADTPSFNALVKR